MFLIILLLISAIALSYPLVRPIRSKTYSGDLLRVLQSGSRVTFLMTFLLCEGTVLWIFSSHLAIYTTPTQRHTVSWHQNGVLFVALYFFASVATSYFYWLFMRIMIKDRVTETEEKKAYRPLKLKGPPLIIAGCMSLASWLIFLRVRL